MASWQYTLPEVLTATMCVFSLNTLKVTGQWYLPSPFLWKCSRVSASRLRAAHRVAGSVPKLLQVRRDVSAARTPRPWACTPDAQTA
jgi:hypothetical protein